MSTNFEAEGVQSEPLEQPTLSQRLMELFPERCRGCYRTEVVVSLTIADLLDGDITEEKAVDRIIRKDSADINIHCVLGKRVVEGIGKSSVCKYKKQR